jgi:hypothetical protein
MVDCPGMYAKDSILELITNYIKNDTAIIFFKSLTGEGLESTQFIKLFDSFKITERNRSSLFLILTGVGNLSPNDVVTFRNAAIKQFKKFFNEQNIILVDSMTQLYLTSLKWDCDINSQLEKMDKNGDLAPFVWRIWFKSNNNPMKFRRMLENISGFKQVRISLENYVLKNLSVHLLHLSKLINKFSNLILKKKIDPKFHLRWLKQASYSQELCSKIENEIQLNFS